MVKQIAIYGLTIYVLGLLFSGITLAFLHFVPYFIAGMIVTTPIYGAVRKYSGKGDKLTFGVKHLQKGLRTILKSTKTSITILGVLSVVVYNAHTDIADILLQTVVIAVVTSVVTFAVWEIARIVANKAKKVQFMSFGEAVKGAF